MLRGVLCPLTKSLYPPMDKVFRPRNSPGPLENEKGGLKESSLPTMVQGIILWNSGLFYHYYKLCTNNIALKYKLG